MLSLPSIIALFTCAFSTGSSSSTPGTTSSNWQVEYSYGGMSNSNSWSQSPAGGSRFASGMNYASSDGYVTVKLTWTNTNTPAPENVAVKFDVSAIASSVVPVDTSGVPMATAAIALNDGFEDTADITVQNSGTCIGHHIKLLNVSGNSARCTIQLSASASCQGYNCYAAVQLTATPLETGAKMELPSLDEHMLPDGTLEAHTIYRMIDPVGSGLVPAAIDLTGDNFLFFEWSKWGSAWSNYPNQTYWPHSNIRVEWQGSGRSLDTPHYTYNPWYDFDYGYYGCYIYKNAAQVSTDSSPLYTYAPTNPETMTLTLTDLGIDGMTGYSFKQKVNVYFHYFADSFIYDTEQRVERSGEHGRRYVQTVDVTPGSTVTVTTEYSYEDSVGFEIGIEQATSTTIPLKIPCINVGIDIGTTQGASVTATHQISKGAKVTVSAANVAPEGATSADVYLVPSVIRKYGATITYTKRGIDRVNVPTWYDDMSTSDYWVRVVFHGPTGIIN